MYEPVKDGVEKSVLGVTYTEAAPPARLTKFVHCFWQLRTESELAEDFTLHAMPDACVNLLFDQTDTAIAGVTALQTNRTFTDQQTELCELVDAFIANGLVEENPITASILSNIADLHSVADMAEVAHLSPRQLQRKLKATTGFTPTVPEIDGDDERVFVTELHPGDALVFDFRTLHGTGDANIQTRRRAFSTRWLGDDVRYVERTGATSPPLGDIGVTPGQRMPESLFPVLFP